MGEQKTKETSQQREQDIFGRQLAEQATPPCPGCGSDRQLLPSRRLAVRQLRLPLQPPILTSTGLFYSFTVKRKGVSYANQ